MPSNRQAIVRNGEVETTESALVVPVPEAEPVVGVVRAQFDPAAPAGIPAHITVLYPFLAPPALGHLIIDELRAIFSGVSPFEFMLPRVSLFPDVVYLPPDPAEPFRRLTAAIATRWPETPPYRGTYDQVIPHLTVAHTDDDATIADIRRKVELALPIVCSAAEVCLFTKREEQWTVEQRFAFQGPGNL